ncbi:hypothetical protein HCU64_23255 [Methylobacterium sp. C25]|uniref:hypothetical protein n=1 Tax=Methylobacterium sp. C25 TaxID=2721622 RepID=UPI001F206101|nr:hypothetical protein [Methylobacterium sp. C25]MCE4226664.1 hypothetical protein [Methylobacterium sp. C25]
MPRWVQIPIIVVIFAIPGALAVVMAWPFLRHRSLPTELDADAIGMMVASVLVGMLVTMMVVPPKQRV